MYGFIRVGSAIPKCKLADCIYNKEKIIRILQQAYEKRHTPVEIYFFNLLYYLLPKMVFMTL